MAGKSASFAVKRHEVVAPAPVQSIFPPAQGFDKSFHSNLQREMAVSNRDGFKDVDYDRMGSDRHRVDQYTLAIKQAVADKKVLDVGTGRDALLAQICAGAGALHVTAVEVVPEAAAEAKTAVQQAGLASKIEVVEGHSMSVSLPRVDVVVHEIVGTLGPEEGLAVVIQDLQHRPEVVNCRRPGWMLPRKVSTLVAPLREVLVRSPGGSPQLAVPRDVKVTEVKRLDAAPTMDQVLSPLRVLDCLDADMPIESQLTQCRTLTWLVDAPSQITGFACAPVLELDGTHSVDAWTQRTSWDHKLLRMATPQLLNAGDEISLMVTAYLEQWPAKYGFDVVVRPRASRLVAASPAPVFRK